MKQPENDQLVLQFCELAWIESLERSSWIDVLDAFRPRCMSCCEPRTMIPPTAVEEVVEIQVTSR